MDTTTQQQTNTKSPLLSFSALYPAKKAPSASAPALENERE